ncbi:hypothetical protein JCM17960_26840 [Magnetospira thiophila]
MTEFPAHQTIQRLLRRIALLLSSVILLLPSLLIAFIEFRTIQGDLDIRSQIIATQVSRFSNQMGGIWQYNYHRLPELVAIGDPAAEFEVNIESWNGETRSKILQVGPAQSFPVFMARSMLIVRGEEIGCVKIYKSGLPLVIQIMIIFFGSLVMAAVVYILFNRYPMQIINKAFTDIERSNDELRQFAYVVSHDLREPLRMVTSFLQLLRRRQGDKLDDSGQSYIDFAIGGAVRMEQLILGLLQYSRVNTEGQPLTGFDPGQATRDAVENLLPAIQEANAQIIGADQTLPRVKGDRSQITQLFQNLIANAIKFRSKSRRPEIRIKAEKSEGFVVFSVEDNGIGIDPQFHDRIFQIFQRLHDREAYEGMGVGLAVCDKVVKRHGGRMWVESTPEQGSTFFFTLPAAF